MPRLASLACLCLAGLAAAAPTTSTPPPRVAPPHVALLYSDYGQYRHRDDYDARLAAMGWPTEKVENKAFAALAPRLREFDLVLGSALYNLGNPQDLLARRDQVVQFVEQGGALVLTDVNYAEHVSFLARLGDGYAAEVGRCDQGAAAVTVVEPEHTLLNWPHRWQPKAGWAHMKLGPRWRVLARCADGAPILAVAPLGLGFIQLSSFWPLDERQLADEWEYLRLRRAGVDSFAATGWDRLAPTTCRAEVRLHAAGEAAVPVTWCVERPTGEVVRAVGQAAGPAATVTLALQLTQRGVHRTWIELGTADHVYASPPSEVRIPEVLELALTEPVYRGYLPLGVAHPRAAVRFTAWPFGADLRNVPIAVELHQGGRTAARAASVAPTGQGDGFTLSVSADKLAAGDCEVVATARRGAQTLATRTFALQVLPAQQPQVLLDGRLSTCVNGRPFFPIGIYHVPDADLAKAREMGFNCCQSWGGPLEVSRKSLDTAAKADMKVILEMSAFLREAWQPDQLRAVVRALKHHPALLAWYTVDEPAAPLHARCEEAYRICREEDPNHPVYLVMCDPSLFARFAPTTDVLAIDPYPVDAAPIRMVADWCFTAAQAVGERQPFWLIPQLQNLTAYTDPTKGRGPTPAEERCMVAQGLVYGAKGLVYYPWDDGPNGLIHDRALQSELFSLNRLLGLVGPALATSSRKLLNDPARPELHAAEFDDGTSRIFVATNTGKQPEVLRVRSESSLNSLCHPPLSTPPQDGWVTLTLQPLEMDVRIASQHD